MEKLLRSFPPKRTVFFRSWTLFDDDDEEEECEV